MFGKIHCGFEESGKEVAFDVAAILAAIPKTASARYKDIDGDVSLGSAIDNKTVPQHFCLWNRRLRGLPQMEKNGTFREVPLEDEEGLAEKTHIIFFPNNIIGYEYNHHGPRVSRLDGYFHDLVPQIAPRFRIQTLVHPDVADRFEDLGDLFSVDLKLTRQYAEVLKSEGYSLGRALSAAAGLGGFDTIAITGSVDRRQGHIVSNEIKKVLRKLIGSRDPGLDIFKVRGQNSQEWLDILKDQISIEVTVEVEQSRTSRSVNSPVMYKRITDSYSKLKGTLEDARLLQ
jgi:hypothetical protein